MGNINLKLNSNFDFVDKLVDENIISTSKYSGNNYWALDTIINKENLFFDSINILKKIIKEVMSYSNLILKENLKEHYKIKINDLILNSLDKKIIFGIINSLACI